MWVLKWFMTRSENVYSVGTICVLGRRPDHVLQSGAPGIIDNFHLSSEKDIISK